MDSPIPPDPYLALGVTKDADADAIKKAYRKLALKLHPDKCTDESQKAARTDEFTKIQQAYDIIGDDEKRRRYDAQVRLAELRRQNMEMRNPSARVPEVRTAAYNTRTAAPREATYSTRPPPRADYEQPRPRYYDNDYEPNRGSTRKASVADEYVYVKRPSPRDEKREKVRVAVDPRDDVRRRDAKRREAEVRESRSTKYERDEVEDDRRRRDRAYEELRRRAEVYDAYSGSVDPVTDERLRQAKMHMESQNRPQRPGMYRRESSRQVPSYHDVPEVKRSSAAPKEKERARESRRESPSKDARRRAAENLDPYGRRVPNLATHTSSPPNLENMVPPPQPPRSHTMPIPVDVDGKKKASKDTSPPPPVFHRSTTQPLETMTGASSSKRKEQSTSKARAGVDSGYSSSAATPGYSTTYSYADEPPAPHIAYNGHRTVLREPTASGIRVTTSPTRMDSSKAPSKGAQRMKDLDPKSVKRTQYSYPSPDRPSIVDTSPRGSTRRERMTDRDRDYVSYERPRPQYFGENGAGTVSPSYDPPSAYEGVNYSPRVRPADIRYNGPPRERPTMSRSSTYVY